MAKKHKVKAHFSHKGKTYKPGDDFESDDQHEIQQLANQGHIEAPKDQAAQPGGAQQGGSSSGSQPGGSKGQSSGAGEDPSKQGR